jgi:aryl-alcohol dehydrogenase-like predicted oxidoreductase
MDTRKLGTTGPTVSAIGLGCMGMSPGVYGASDEAESVATIHAAIDSGVTLLDTGDFYGMGHNEMLIGRALRDRSRDDVALSVKFGAQRGPDGAWLGFDGSPAAVKTSLAYTLQRLGTDHVDVYRPARLDPDTPVEDTVGAIAELVEAGFVRHIGLSEVGAETIHRAAAVAPIADLQIEWSLISRGVEDEIVDACREHGIAITAYGVLSRGLISGHWSRERDTSGSDFRSTMSPRFQGDALDHNLQLVETLREVADGVGASPAQVAIAWVLARGEDVIPVIGARRRDRLDEALGALDVTLGEDALARLEEAFPPGAAEGDRYAAAQMAMLDSER